MRRHKLIRLAHVGPVLALALGVSGSKAAEEDDLVAADTLTTEQLTFVSQSGKEIVQHLEKARKELDRSNFTRARWETGKARAILGRVREKSPSLSLHDRIATALKELRSGAKPKRETLLPIYAELDVTENTMDVADVRSYVDKARAGVDGGDVEVAEDNLLEASARVQYTEIDLPIEETYHGLSRALIQMQNKQPMAAKVTLSDAEKHIQGFIVIASDSIEDATSDVSAGPE